MKKYSLNKRPLISTLCRFVVKEITLQKATIMELIIGLCMLFFLWFFFQNQNNNINIIGVFTWCFKFQPDLYFSLMYIIVGSFFLILFILFTSITEIFIRQKRIAMLIRSIMVLINCIPIYVYIELWRHIYGYHAKPNFNDYFFYGIGALIFGNAIWLYLHRYFVENLKIELMHAHFETGSALGLSRIWIIWPKIRLLILDVVRPILLILLGSAIFVENRFRYISNDTFEFQGISYLFAYDLNQMSVRHDYEMILGIIFSVLLFSTLIQICITKIRYHYDPEVRYDK